MEGDDVGAGQLGAGDVLDRAVDDLADHVGDRRAGRGVAEQGVGRRGLPGEVVGVEAVVFEIGRQALGGHEPRGGFAGPSALAEGAVARRRITPIRPEEDRLRRGTMREATIATPP